MGFTILKDEKCPGCYGAGKVLLDGKEHIAFVSELEKTGVIDLLDPDTFETVRASEGPGGGMNIIPLKKDGEFLCIQKFYPVFKSEDAVVIWGYKENGKYTHKEVQPLPFVHRIECITVDGKDYLFCASLCKTKEFTDDWRFPGSVYTGEIDYEKREIHDFHVIYDGIIQDHGLTKLGEHGERGLLISGKNGVNLLTHEADGWKVENLVDEPTRDCVVADLDGDGVEELGTITPFHGAFFSVYKKIDGKYQKVWTLPGKHEFGHAIWGGRLNGRPAFLIGYRAGEMGLYLVEYVDGQYTFKVIDEHSGPANVTVVHSKQGDLICAANRQTDRYTVYKED